MFVYGIKPITIIWILQREYPIFVFLMETKLYVGEMENIRVKIGFDNGLFVDCVNRGGGLCLLWKADLDISIWSYSKFHIDVDVNCNQGQGDGD